MVLRVDTVPLGALGKQVTVSAWRSVLQALLTANAVPQPVGVRAALCGSGRSTDPACYASIVKNGATSVAGALLSAPAGAPIDAPQIPANKLLAALPADVYERLRPHLRRVPLALGASVYEAGGKQPYVYFPTDAIVSLLYVMKDGASAEIAVVGNEGLVGIALFMGGETTPSRAVVQSAGEAFRLASKRLKHEFEAGGALQHLLLRYTQALITQMAQTAVCNRHHSIEQQLCRSLLLSVDRLPTNVLTMTQELIANMLGVRREGVTDAAGKLQEAGMIHYSRGRITVLDRPQLEQRVCECYAVVKKEFARLLPDEMAR